MFALVKFISDSEKQQVPVSFIENFDVAKEACHVPGLVKPVFWSPVEGETPRDVLEKQGIILHPDKEVESKRSKRKLNEALAGYYDAEILSLAESENQLDQQITVKRIRASTDKARELREESKAKKDSQRKKDTGSKTMNSKNAKKAGSKDNLRKLLSLHSSDSEDDELLPLGEVKKKMRSKEKELQKEHDATVKTLNDEVSSLKKKLKKANKEKEELASEVETLKELNLKYQRKFLDSPKRKKESSSPSSLSKDLVSPYHLRLTPQKTMTSNLCLSPKNYGSSTPLNSSSKVNPSKSEGNNTLKEGADSLVRSLDFSENSSPAEKISSPKTPSSFTPNRTESNSSNVSPEKNVPSPANTSKEVLKNIPPSSTHRESPSKKCSSPKKTSNIVPLETLDPEDIKKCEAGLKFGEKGDSLFIKNAAVKLFTEEKLKRSSLTGRRCPTKPNAAKKPALDARKLEYLETLLVNRIKKELKGASDEYIDRAVLLRGSKEKVNKFVREHIAWLNRSSLE